MAADEAPDVLGRRRPLLPFGLFLQDGNLGLTLGKLALGRGLSLLKLCDLVGEFLVERREAGSVVTVDGAAFGVPSKLGADDTLVPLTERDLQVLGARPVRRQV